MELPSRGRRSFFGKLGGEGFGLEGGKLGHAALDGLLRLSSSWGVEVVARLHSSQPVAQALEVGLGLLYLGVGGASSLPLVRDLFKERWHARDDLLVLI